MSWKDGSAAAMWIPVLNAAEARNGIPNDLLARQCDEESAFNPEASNPSGAVGIMQLLPKFFPGAGQDAVKDIETAAEYLASLFKRFSDWQLALAGYDWGPTALAKALKQSNFSILSLPTETQEYVTAIITDVPVQGILCRTLSPLKPPPTGSQPVPSSVAQAPVPQPPNSLWHSVTTIFSRRSAPNLAAPLPPSASPSLPISSQTASVPLKEISMSTPNPVLVTVAPEIQGILAALTAFDNAMGADPAKWAGNFPGAKLILDGTMLQQLTAVVPAFGGLAVSSLNGLWASLAAKVTTATKPAA
jgi:Transglycosylase SLT domain